MPARGSHRLFVAVDPPAVVADALAAWAQAQRTRGAGLRVVPPANAHLTLAFLGERPAADVDAVAAVLAEAVGEWTQAHGGHPGPVELELGPPIWLPPRRPHALAAEVADPTGRLAALRDTIVLGITAAIGWEGEPRRFLPHLTAARVSGRRRGEAGLLDPTPAGRFAVTEVVLYRSFLDPAGARYEALERVPLG